MNLRDIAIDIFQRTLTTIEIGNVVQQTLQRRGDILHVGAATYDLQNFSHVLLLAIGKAALPMARAATNILGACVTAGIVASNEHTAEKIAPLKIFCGGHPLPTQGSIDVAGAALELLRTHNDKKTLVIFLLSGGGSALFEKPCDDSITLADLQTINRVLVGCGAVIHEMNVIRKFLSAVKGGRLAAAANQSQQISLYISDVNSDDLATVSSGLTLPSNITRDEIDAIVARYNLLEKFPPHVAALFSPNNLPPLPNVIATEKRMHHLLLDNRAALQIAQQIARENYQCVVEIADDLIEGEVEAMAQEHLARLKILRAKNPHKIVCLLSGGEVICPVRGNGQGGRNQEFVLRAARHVGAENIAIVSAGTDGIDGQSPAAGASADGNTMTRAQVQKLAAEDFLARSDSYNFFHALGDAIITGPTGNNVRDLRILLAQ